MKNKGVTLIELLAVIVILAIIALIAVPIVLNIINDSKISATERSKEMYLKAVEQAIARKNLTSSFNPSVCTVKADGNLTCDAGDLIVEVNGKNPKEGGTITLEDGKIISNTLEFGNTGGSGGSPSSEGPTYILSRGNVFNNLIKELANGKSLSPAEPDYKIENIKFLENGTLPSGYTKDTLTALKGVDVSNEGDGCIMAYYDENGTIYVYSDKNIYLNDSLSSMFSYLSGLTSLDLSNLDTNNVTDMSYMFSECSSLQEILVSNYWVENAYDDTTFEGCGVDHVIYI